MSALSAYLETSLRRPFHVIVPTTLGLALGSALAFGFATRHRATVSLAVELTPGGGALTPSMASAILARRLPAFRKTISDAAGIEGVRGAVDVRAIGADRLTLAYVDGDPRRAVIMANRLAALLVESAARQQPGAVSSVSLGLEDRLAQVKSALEANEEARSRLRETGAAKPVDRPADAAAASRLHAEHAVLLQRLREARAELARLRGMPQDTSGSPVDPELERLRQELSTLRARYTDEHPDVESVRRRIAERDAAAGSATPVTTNHDEHVQTTVAEIESLSARQAQLESEIARLRPPARAWRASEQQRLLAQLELEEASLRDSYRTLLREQEAGRRGEADALSRPTEFLRVVGPATLAAHPHFPSRWLLSLGGLLAGLAVGLVGAHLAEGRDHSVKTVGELEELLEVPVLAEVPFVPARRSRR